MLFFFPQIDNYDAAANQSFDFPYMSVFITTGLLPVVVSFLPHFVFYASDYLKLKHSVLKGFSEEASQSFFLCVHRDSITTRCETPGLLLKIQQFKHLMSTFFSRARICVLGLMFV